MAIRRQHTSMRTVEAYHRALDTMGKLAAQQAGAPRPAKPVDPEHPYVRVVRDDTAPPAPPRPPSSRSRSRRARQTPPAAAVAAAGPNTRIVVSEEDPGGVLAPAAPSPGPGRDGGARGKRRSRVDFREEKETETSPAGPGHPGGRERAAPAPETATGRPTLRFDASDDYGPPVGPAASWAEVEPSQPYRAVRPRPRPRPTRPRWRPGRLRAGSRAAVRHWRAAASVAAALIIAGVVAASLVSSGAGPGHPKTPTSHAPPAHVVAPPASVQTTPTTTPVTAVLVASSAGSSTYRVGSSATIGFRATTGTCWVEIRESGPYGPVVFTGDIFSGQTKELNGPVWVRLGNPGVITVSVNGASLSPPGMIAGEPYDLQFA